MLSLDSYNSETCAPCDTPQNHSLSHDDLCPVCLDDGENSECDVILMPCFHSFHGSCILNWVERNFSCPMCRAEVENFVPMKGQTLEPRFVEIWEEHFLASTEEPAPEETKKSSTSNKTVSFATEEIVIPLPLDEEEKEEEEVYFLLDEEEMAFLFEEEPLRKLKENGATMPPTTFDPVVYSNTLHPQHPVLPAPVLTALLEAAVPFLNTHQRTPTVVRLPNMTVSGALVLHTLAQQNYQLPHQLKKSHARSHLQTKMQALNRVAAQQRRPLSTTVKRVKPIRMDLAFRLPSPPRGSSIPPQPVLRQQARTTVVNAAKHQVVRKVHTKLAILARGL